MRWDVPGCLGKRSPLQWDPACPSIPGLAGGRLGCVFLLCGLSMGPEFGTATVQSLSSFTFQSALGLETFHKLNLKVKPNILIKGVSSPVGSPM